MSRPCRKSRALPIASSAWRFSSTAIRDGERLHEIERDEPRHGDEEGGNAERDAAERAERLQRDHTRRREQREAADDGGEVEQRDPHEHAPMRPAGAEPFARRHRAALAGPHDAFDERAFADEAHDEGRDDREDDRRLRSARSP